MDNYFSIFQSLLSTEGTYLNIYLDGLDEHGQFGLQSNDEASFVQHISSLLTTSKTRAIGLRLLNKLVDKCSLDVIEKKGNLWTTLVLKACNGHELDNDPITFQILNKIIKSTQHVPDLEKSFINTNLSKIYESLTNVPSSKSKYALNCIETCLRLYPGSSGPSRGGIERFLWKNVDHIDYEFVQSCGKCLHLLQQIKGGGVQGINHKAQWKNYQLQLLGGIHSIYTEMFAYCKETYDDKIEQQKLPWEAELNAFDPDPVKKAAQMYTRCRNLVTYLCIALREPFPVEKPILIKKILNVVIRGLSVNCLMLERNINADNIALSILLPKLHEDLLHLLNVIVIILRGHIRPYSEVILGLLVDELKWTSVKSVNRHHKNLWSLRKRVYDTVSVWCKIFNGGNRCETIAENLFQEILNDITPTQSEFTLKVLSGARKHMSKKARRQLQNAQNKNSNLAKTFSSYNNREQHPSESRNHILCIAGLNCFYQIIFSVANLLKPTILKMMQTSIIQISALFYENAQKPGFLYSNENCRIEIYNVLCGILIGTHHLCPPPTDLILKLIQTAYIRDNSLKVRNRCGVIIRNLEKIIHPQKESLLFTIESRDIRNTFIKMGHENLLREFEPNFSNASNDDYGIIDHEEVEASESPNYQFPNASLGDTENDVQNTNKPIIENKEVKSKQNKMQIDSVDLKIVTQSVNVPVPDVSNIEVVTNKLFDDGPLIGEEIDVDKNVDNIPKSPEIVLRVEDHVDDATANQEKYGMSDFNNDEPMMKKQKLHNEHIEHIEHNDTNNREKLNIISNIDLEEDSMLADIASQFVDELD